MYTFSQIQKMEKSFPQSYLIKNLKAQKVDYFSLSKSDPILFQSCTSIMEDEFNAKSRKLWSNYQKAYADLKKADFFITPIEINFEKAIKALEDKVNNVCLIPVQELKQCVTQRKKNGVISIEFDYHDFQGLIEKYYNIVFRGFFQKEIYDLEKKLYKKYLGVNSKEIKKLSNMELSQSVKATKLCMISDIVYQKKMYIDFWHYLLDNDFEELSNGSTNYLGREHIEVNLEEDHAKIKNRVFSLMRAVYFKEAKQLPYYKKNALEELDFYISW